MSHDLDQEHEAIPVCEQPETLTSPSHSSSSLFNFNTSFYRALDTLAANTAEIDKIDDLAIAITRRDLDLIAQVLTIPGFTIPDANAREKEFIRKLYNPQPLLYALKLQSIAADSDFGDGGKGWSRAAVVAYLMAHREELTRYMSARGQLGRAVIQATPTPAKLGLNDPSVRATTTIAEAEAMMAAEEASLANQALEFAQSEEFDNPALLSAARLGLSKI